MWVNTPTINASGRASVTVTGARPGRKVELQGYSQRHDGTAGFADDPTPTDRSGIADDRGWITFDDLRLGSNTRVRARHAGCQSDPNDRTAVVNVRAQQSLTVTRDRSRTYTFSGRSMPARPGGLIVSLYRIVGSPCAAGVESRRCPGEVLIGQARATPLGAPDQGLYRITKTFPAQDAGQRVQLVIKTNRDAQNAPGRSNTRPLLIT